MNVFAKDRRGVPKTVRLTDHQREILDLLVEIRGPGSTATDVILDALDMLTEMNLGKLGPEPDYRRIPLNQRKKIRQTRERLQQLQQLVNQPQLLSRKQYA